MAKPIVGYWNTRGLCQPIRTILKYKEVDFEDKHYVQTDPPELSKEDWFKEKFSLGLPLPNVPYIIDGDVKMTETSAILGYLGRKYGLSGSTEEAKQRNDMTYSFQNDLKWQFIRIAYNRDQCDQLLPGFKEQLPQSIKKLSDWLGDRKWFAGDEMTVCDFCTWELLKSYQALQSDCVEQDNLKSFIERFEAIPTIKAYLDSDEFKTLEPKFFGKAAAILSK